MKEWVVKKLGEIAEFTNGGAWKPDEYVESGIPVVRVSDIQNETVNLEQCKYLSPESFTKYKKHALFTGDLVITTVGSHPTQPGSVVGRPGIVPDYVQGALLNQNAVRIAPANDALDKKYLGFLGKSQVFRDYIIGHARGSANQVRMSIELIKEMEVHLPPLLIQRKIATILSAYDDLIENNTRRIEILEEMARSLYREWFVNFRFPGHEQVKMVDSELGLIPEGWKVVPLEKLTHPKKPIQYGVLKPGESDDNGVLLIRGGDILNGTIATYQLRTITKEVSNKYKRTLLEGGELIVSLVGNPGEVAVVPEKLKGANIARQAGRVVLQKELYTPYVMRFLMSDKGRGELFASTTGSVQKVINIIALKQVRILLPQDSVLHKAVPIFNSIYQYQEILREKIQNFRQTRDLLLPKLISGEIDVENLDIALEEIAA